MRKERGKDRKEGNGKGGLFAREKSTSSVENRIVVPGSIRERARILERSKPGIQFIHWFSFGGITPSGRPLESVHPPFGLSAFKY